MNTNEMALSQGITLSLRQRQDAAAMMAHSVPTSSLLLASGVATLAITPLLKSIGASWTAVGQRAMLQAIDAVIDKAENVTDAVEDDGSLRPNAPLTVSLAIGDEPLKTAHERRTSMDRQRKIAMLLKSVFRNRNKQSVEVHSFAENAYSSLENFRDGLHNLSDANQANIKKLVKLLVGKLSFKFATVLLLVGLRKASKVVLAYLFCGLLDNLRISTPLGRLLFLDNRIAPLGLLSSGMQSEVLARPYFMSSSFRFVMLAFLSEPTAVMNFFQNILGLKLVERAAATSNGGIVSRATNSACTLLSQTAFFYDANSVSPSATAAVEGHQTTSLPLRFVSLKKALFTLTTFQFLPFVFGHRHLTSMSPVDRETLRATLTLLGPKELTYWMFLRDFTEVTFSSFYALAVDRNFSRYLVHIASNYGYKSPLQLELEENEVLPPSRVTELPQQEDGTLMPSKERSSATTAARRKEALTRPTTIKAAVGRAMLFACLRYLLCYLITSFAQRFVNSSCVDPVTGKATSQCHLMIRLIHNALCSILDGKKGVAYVWFGSVVPGAILISPIIMKRLATKLSIL